MTSRALRLIVATAMLGAGVGYASTFFRPTLYASESALIFVPQRVPENFVRGAVKMEREDRLRVISDQVLTRTRLERIISELGLYADERETAKMEDVVRTMRDRITVLGINDGFRVRFADADARQAMRVTERLTSLFVEENLRNREVTAEGTSQFLESQIYDTGVRLDQQEAEIERLRQTGKRVPQSDLLRFEVLQTSYRSLITMSEEARVSANLERRNIGEQVKVIEAARLPERPLDRGGLKLSLMSGLAGLALGLGFVLVRPRS